jgi:hypothetical protein
MCRLCSPKACVVTIRAVRLGTSTGRYAAGVSESVMTSLPLRSTCSTLLWVITSSWEHLYFHFNETLAISVITPANFCH